MFAKMMQLCRTCHNEITSDDCIALNDNNVNSGKVKSQLLLCVPELQQDLVKNRVLCSPCVSALHVAYTFKGQCSETEKRIRKYFLNTNVNEKSVTFVELYKQVMNAGAVCNNSLEQDSVKSSNSDSNEHADTESIISLEAFSGTRDIDVGNVIVKDDCDLTQFKVENFKEDYLASNYELDKLSLLQLLDESLQQITQKRLKNSEDGIDAFNGHDSLTESQPGNVSKTTFSPITSENRCGITETVKSSHNGNEREYLKKENVVSKVITNADTNCKDGIREVPTKECFVKLVTIEDVHRLHSGNALEATFSPTRPENQCASTDTESSTNGKGQQELLTKIATSNVVICTDGKPYVCTACEFRTSLRRTLIQHTQSHTEEKPFHSARRDYLKTHMKTRTGKKHLQCNICEFRTISKYLLTKHMITHTGDTPFQCNICGYCAVQKSNLKSHMMTHTGDKPFTCKICKFSYARQTALRQHMRTHTGEIPWQCNVCNYRTIYKENLISHMRTHTGEKPFQCNVCDYKAISKRYLIRHMGSHTGDTPFQCNLCDYKAGRKQNLIEHMRTHTGEKPFQCNVCDYRTAHKQNLIIHMRSHTGEKPFQCNLCDFKGGQKRQLIIHMRTHTGEKPFQCNVCDFRTAHKQNLERHMRTHHFVAAFAI